MYSGLFLSMALSGISPNIPNEGLYCIEHGKDQIVFSAKPISDNKLKFAFSIWADHGHFFGVAGVATGHKDHWDFFESSDTPSDPGCKIRIDFGPDRSVQITADPERSCKEEGSEHLRVQNFRKQDRRRAAGRELTEGYSFFEDGVKC